MNKKLLVVLCCVVVGGSVQGMDTALLKPRKAQEKKILIQKIQQQKSETESQDDFLTKLGVAPAAKFFIQFQDKKIKISRAGVMRCSFFVSLVETDVQGEPDKSEYILPWRLETISVGMLTSKMIQSFVDIVEAKTDYSQLGTPSLCVLINMANYAQQSLVEGYQPDRDIFAELYGELLNRLKNITKKDYLDFLSGTGLLWSIVRLLPHDILDELKNSWLIQSSVVLHDNNGKIEKLIRLSDGRLAAASDDGAIRLWDPNNPQKNPIVLPGGRVIRLKQLSNGMLASVVQPKTIALWDPYRPKKKPIVSWTTTCDILSIVEVPEGKIALGLRNGKIILWDPKTPTQEPVILDGAHQAAIFALEMLPGDKLASGFRDGMIIVWDLKDNTYQELIRHTNNVSSFIPLPENCFASESLDGTVRIWNLNKSSHELEILGNEKNGIWSAKVLSGGRIAVGSVEGEITNPFGIMKIWDLKNLKKDPVILRGHKHGVIVKIELPDGRLISFSHDSTIIIWDLTQAHEPIVLRGHTAAIYGLVELSAGKFASGSYDGTIRLWDLFLDLTFEQAFFVRALQWLARENSGGIWEQLKKKIKKTNVHISYEEIFSTQKVLNLFVSLPRTRIQELAVMSDVQMLHVAVKQLLGSVQHDIDGPSLSDEQFEGVHKRLLKAGELLIMPELSVKDNEKRKLIDYYKKLQLELTTMSMSLTTHEALDKNEKNEKRETE